MIVDSDWHYNEGKEGGSRQVETKNPIHTKNLMIFLHSARLDIEPNIEPKANKYLDQLL